MAKRPAIAADAFDVQRFVPAMPATVRAALDDPESPAAAWRTAPDIVAASLALVNQCRDRELVGWLAGMAMFVDYHRELAEAIVRGLRFDIVPFVLDAIVAGLALEHRLPRPKKLWVAIETLVRRSPRVPDALVDAVVVGCCHDDGQARWSAVGVAAMLGTRARDALHAARATATPEHAKRLDAAIARLTSPPELQPFEQLLGRALAEWRVTHDPALERPIALIGAHLATARAMSYGYDWLAIAHANDPTDHDRLVECAWPADEPTVCEQLSVFARRAPDPRDVELLRLARAHHGWATSAAIHDRIAAIVARVPGPRHAELRAALLAERPELAAHYPPPRSVEPSHADLALVDELARVTAPLDRRRTLFDQVAADPDDLAVRSVLADVLEQAGDPRGRLMALELAGIDDDEVRLLRSRQAAHTYVTALPMLEALRTRCERGFVVELATYASADQLRASAHRPEWATIEHLRVYSALEVGDVVRRMPRLRRLDLYSAVDGSELTAAGPFPRLHTLFTSGWLPHDRAMFPALRVAGGVLTRGREVPTTIAEANALGLTVLVWVIEAFWGMRDVVARRADGPPVMRVVNSLRNPGWMLELPRDGHRARCWFDRFDSARSLVPAVAAMVREVGISTLAVCTTEPVADLDGAGLAIEADPTRIDLEAVP
ncbi:MAG TPA: hypothetical protein VFQ53_01665 [Kofleriaceae bacterium]|nr:hypothetical protein [Kofleriaceae bacterium]